MIQFKKIKNLILLASLFISTNYSNEPTLNDAQKEEITNSINIIKNSIQQLDIKEIIKNTKSTLSEHKERKAAIRQEKLKNQNTLIFSLPNSNNNGLKIGFYKRDIIEGSTFLANSYAHYLIYKEIINEREKFILNSFINNIDKLEQCLENDLNGSIKKNNRWYKRMFQKNELDNFIYNNCSYIGNNIFKPTLAIPLIKKLVINYFTELLENKLIIKTPLWIHRITEKAYENDGVKEVETLNPISIVSSIKTIIDPIGYLFNNILNFIPSNEKKIILSNKFFNIGIPDKLLHKNSVATFKAIGKILSTTITLKNFDYIQNQILIKHIRKNRTNLLKLIQNYKKSQNSDDSREKIGLFIKEAYKINLSSFISNHLKWIYSINKGNICTNLLANTPLASIITYKFYNWIKSLDN